MRGGQSALWLGLPRSEIVVLFFPSNRLISELVLFFAGHVSSSTVSRFHDARVRIFAKEQTIHWRFLSGTGLSRTRGLLSTPQLINHSTRLRVPEAAEPQRPKIIQPVVHGPNNSKPHELTTTHDAIQPCVVPCIPPLVVRLA